jgi:GNAT superfamily N-acetyltransferase
MCQDELPSLKSQSITKATQDDRDQIAKFLNQNNSIHRHLDWFTTLDWLGSQTFLVEKSHEHIQGVLCATPENNDSAWVRTFCAKKQISIDEIWKRLLVRAIQKLHDRGIERLGALALQNWFRDLLVNSGFKNQQNIIILKWQQKLPPLEHLNHAVVIRPMKLIDLPQVEEIDRIAFPSLWQNSLAGLTKAFKQPGICTVAIINGQLVGYQISTLINFYGHLARLAVHPEYQRLSIASALVDDLLKQFKQQGAWQVTVNTQSDNKPSLKLYDKFGFTCSGDEIPVYELIL